MSGDQLAAIVEHLERQGSGRIGIGFDGSTWSIGYEFGREAPDSSMYGGASYGIADDLTDALQQIIAEVRIEPATEEAGEPREERER